MNRTLKTRCSLCLNNGVSKLASNCVVGPIVVGSKLCVHSSCTQIFSSTRLTQISAVFLLLSGFCVAVVVFCCSSVCVVVAALFVFLCVCVVFIMSFGSDLTVVFPDVFVSLKVIFGKLYFLLVSSFLADRTSLASRTGVVVDLSYSWCGDFVKSGFLFVPFVGGRLCHLGSERLSSRSNEPWQLWVDSFHPADSESSFKTFGFLTAHFWVIILMDWNFVVDCIVAACLVLLR